MANPVRNISETIDVEIASGQSKSDGFNLVGRVPTALYMPATFTGTSITFEASWDGVTFVPLHAVTGGVYSVAVGASRCLALNHTNFYGVKFCKVVSGSTEGGAREILMALGTDHE